MTDKELIAWLRDLGFNLTDAAADRIEALTKERERLALAICGGEDAPGYANAQTVETLEKVARDWAMGMMEQINRTLALEAKLTKAVEALKDMCLEFRQADLPYGSAAYAKATATLAEIKGESHEALP